MEVIASILRIRTDVLAFIYYLCVSDYALSLGRQLGCLYNLQLTDICVWKLRKMSARVSGPDVHNMA